MIWLLLIGLALLIEADAPQVVTLEAHAGPVDVTYTAAGAEVVRLSARALDDPPIDVTLEVLDGDARLTYADDNADERPDLAPTDAVIERLVLPRAGTYRLRIHSFSGAQSGAVEVRITPYEPAPPCVEGAVWLRRGAGHSCALTLSAGDRLDLRARDLLGPLDPMLTLIDPTSAVVAANDDHPGIDPTLHQLDAHLADFTAPAAGVYTLRVTDFAGRAGPVALLLGR